MAGDTRTPGRIFTVVSILVLVAIAVPILYLLSLGPVAWVANRFDLTGDAAWAVEVYFEPGYKLHATGYADWLNTYVEWFVS